MKTSLLLSLGLAAIIGFFAILGTPVSAAPAAQFTPYPTPTPGPDGQIIYIVEEGDSAWRIAAIFNIPLDKLYELNHWDKDHVIRPGDQVFLGLAGPQAVTPAAGPTSTPLPVNPTQTPPPGWGNLCVLLYNDRNGDGIRQEEEPALAGGAISVSNRDGSVSRTADTDSGAPDSVCNADAAGFVMFETLPEGYYNITVAVPDGYNATTVLNSPATLNSGQIIFISFGAQANAETAAEIPVIPDGQSLSAIPGRSPLLGILGGAIVLLGVGLGVYAALLRRR